eukprot:441603-Prymnesium_polylepis.1
MFNVSALNKLHPVVELEKFLEEGHEVSFMAKIDHKVSGRGRTAVGFDRRAWPRALQHTCQTARELDLHANDLSLSHPSPPAPNPSGAALRGRRQGHGRLQRPHRRARRWVPVQGWAAVQPGGAGKAQGFAVDRLLSQRRSDVAATGAAAPSLSAV